MPLLIFAADIDALRYAATLRCHAATLLRAP